MVTEFRGKLPESTTALNEDQHRTQMAPRYRYHFESSSSCNLPFYVDTLDEKVEICLNSLDTRNEQNLLSRRRFGHILDDVFARRFVKFCLRSFSRSRQVTNKNLSNGADKCAPLVADRQFFRLFRHA